MPYLRTPGRGGGRRGVRSGRGPPLPSVAHSALPAISDSASSRFESRSSSRLFARALETTASAPFFDISGSRCSRAQSAAPKTVSAMRRASLAFSVRGLRASCRLTQLRCWVAPSPEVSCPASEPAHFLRSRSSVRLRRGYTWPLFLHTSAGVNPAGSVPGVQEAAVPAAGADSVGTSPPQTAPGGQCKAAYAAANVVPRSGR